MPSVTDRLLIMYGILLQRFFLCYNSCVEECFWNEVFHLVKCIPKMKWWYLLGIRMGMSEVVMLAMMGHMVVLGMALGTLMVPGYWSLQMG